MNRDTSSPAPALQNEQDYNLQRRHPERASLYASYAQRSEDFREAVPWQSFSYDEPSRCTVDWFPAEDAEGAPLLVFVHGGYWRGGDKRIFSFLAEGFRAAGVSTALVGYELAPAVSIGVIGQQVRRAIRYLMQAQPSLGFDPRRVTLAGHSAGAHLVVMASAYPQELGIDAANLKVIGVSGVYDLTPVLQTSLREEIGLTPAHAAEQSLPNHRRLQASGYLLLAGEKETPSFIEQTRMLHRELLDSATPCELRIVPDCTHFDIFIPMADPNHPVHRSLLDTVLRRPPASS